jgi:hypothetical protein
MIGSIKGAGVRSFDHFVLIESATQGCMQALWLWPRMRLKLIKLEHDQASFQTFPVINHSRILVMNMAAPSFQPDLRFGFPSWEPGTGFNEETSCHYYEALQYASSNGTHIRCSNGDLDHPSILEWLAKVLFA